MAFCGSQRLLSGHFREWKQRGVQLNQHWSASGRQIRDGYRGRICTWLKVPTFDVEISDGLVSFAVANILTFIFVPNSLNDQNPSFVFSLYSHHLWGLDFCLIIEPSHRDIFVQFTVQDNLVLFNCCVILQFYDKPCFALWNVKVIWFRERKQFPCLSAWEKSISEMTLPRSEIKSSSGHNRGKKMTYTQQQGGTEQQSRSVRKSMNKMLCMTVNSEVVDILLPSILNDYK